MNLGHEQIPSIGYQIEAELAARIREEHDAFILEYIRPYCEQEIRREIKKKDLIQALLNYAQKPVLRIKHQSTLAFCPTCHRLLDQDEYPIACGFCGQRLDWEAET